MKIKQFFVLLAITAQDEVRTAFPLNIVLGCITVSLGLYALVLPLVVSPYSGRFYLLSAAIPLLIYIYLLNKRGQMRLAEILLVCGLWLLITASALTSGEVHSPFFGTYTIVVLLGGLLIGRGAGIAIVVGSAVAGLIMAWNGGRKQTEENSQQLLHELETQRSQLRALNMRLAKMEENERKRLARELHDGVAQNLTGLNLNLNVLQRHMLTEVATDSRVHPRLKDAITLVEQATVQIRNIMADLRPPVLDDYGLLATLQWYAAQLVLDTGLPVEVLGEVLTPRPAEYVELTLFRIVQEALTNSVKHAQATQAIVVLTADNTTIYVSINDDGMGIDATCGEHSTQQQGWGLITMRERAETIGGHCHIESFPFLGTSVMVEVQR